MSAIYVGGGDARSPARRYAVAPSGPGPAVPPVLPTTNMIAYFIGDAGVTDAGGVVSLWTGQGAYALPTATQASAPNQPTKDSLTVVGRTGIKFDNTSVIQGLYTNSIANPAALTWHKAVYLLAGSPNGQTCGVLTGRYMNWRSSNTFQMGDGYWSNAPAASVGMHLFSMRSIAGGAPDGLFRTYIDGVETGVTHDSGQGYGGSNPLIIGGHVGNGWFSANHTLYADVLYDANQSDVDFAATVAALKTYYGIA